MSEPKWTLSKRGDYSDFDGNSRVLLAGDKRIAAIHTTGSKDDEAIASLIVAAPDLLEALANLLGRARTLDKSATDEGLRNCQAIAQARAAIVKAKTI